MNKILFTSLACLALACGGLAEDANDGITEVVYDSPSEPSVFDYTVSGDGIGTAEQALSLLSALYGRPSVPANAQDPCWFPNTASSPCYVAGTKANMVFGWKAGSVTTNSNVPDIDWRERLIAAMGDLSGLNLGWSDVTYGEGQQTKTAYLSSNTNGALATDTVEYNTANIFFKSATSHNPAGYYAYTTGVCTIRINPAVIGAQWNSQTHDWRMSAAKRLLKHEVGHCFGFNDLTFGNGTYLMYAVQNTAPDSFSPAEVNALKFFQP